jgi:hypothetical protein
VVAIGPVIGMVVAGARIELLGHHAPVSRGLLLARHCGDRRGRPKAEDGAHQKGAQHGSGPPPGQIAARLPRHPNDATTTTTNLPHPHASLPRCYECARRTVDYPADNY